MKIPLFLLSLAFAFTYWLLESVVHYKIFHDSSFKAVPTDLHELWMRFTVTVLIILFGVISEIYSKKIIKKEIEKWDVYTSMIKANNHILNNFMQKMYLFKLEAEESKDFDKDVLSRYSEIINETKAQIKNLEGIENPQKQQIEDRLKSIL